MKGYFLSEGKYKSGVKVLEIKKVDVKDKVIYDVHDKDAEAFYKAGLLCYEGQKPVEVKKEEAPMVEVKKEPKKEIKKDNKKK
jgi:hypothetical protein